MNVSRTLIVFVIAPLSAMLIGCFGSSFEEDAAPTTPPKRSIVLEKFESCTDTEKFVKESLREKTAKAIEIEAGKCNGNGWESTTAQG